MIRLQKILLTTVLAIALLTIASCESEVDPLADITQFKAEATIAPNFKFKANFVVYQYPEMRERNSNLGLSLYHSREPIIYDERGLHFGAPWTEILHLPVPMVNLTVGCTDYNQLATDSLISSDRLPLYYRANFDEIGEDYRMLYDENTTNQVCISYVSADEKIIEGTFDFTVVLNTESSFGTEKPYAPWLPDTLRFTNGVFRAREAIEF